MGSFAMTCAVSGLPIEVGNRVRYFLLTQNPYHESLKCYIHDLWFPRGYPLRATYNDYGSVENIESGATRQAWLDAFQLDLIERGWGDNSCHDLSTSKAMTFAHLLKAVWEGRVLVKPEIPFRATYGEFTKTLGKLSKRARAKVEAALGPVTTAPQEEPLPKGIPTLKGIEGALTAGGVSLFDGSHNGALMVDDDEGHGRVRVRVGDFGGKDVPVLEKAAKLLQQAGYATMITQGTGSYAHGAELLVRPLPGTEGYHFVPHTEKAPLQVMQAMVREDVWERLVRLKVEDDWSGKILEVGQYREGAQIAWDQLVKTGDEFLTRMTLENDHKSKAGAFAKDAIPFTVGLATAFGLVARRAKKMSKKAVAAFLDNAAEFMFLHVVLSGTRYQWRPSYSNGPQFGQWKQHGAVLAALREVVTAQEILEAVEARSA